MSSRRLARYALLTALAMALSWLESLVPLAGAVPPGVKLGLTNLVVIFALYKLGPRQAAVISLVLTLALGPVAFTAVGSLFWFFTYRLTLTPFLIVVPVFALLGILVPLAVYRAIARSTIVERLRQE